MTNLVNIETDVALELLQSAACICWIALGRWAEQKVLTLKTTYRNCATHIVVVTVGIHATPDSIGSPPKAQPGPLPWCTRTQCQAACRDYFWRKEK
jgi:hypothetical protein